MARKFSSAYNSIDPLMRLTIEPIDGSPNDETECVLVQNSITHVGRGTQSYILDLREGILSGYTCNWAIPPDAQRDWFFNKGPVFTPENFKSSTTTMWLKPENFLQPVDGTSFAASWKNAVTTKDFTQNSAAKYPALSQTNTSNNKYKFITTTSTDNLFQNPIDGDFAVDVSADNFAVIGIFTTPSSLGSANNFILDLAGTSGNCYRLFTNGTSIRQRFGVATANQWASSLAADTTYIFALGSDDKDGGSGSPFCRLNGTDLGAATGSTSVSDISFSASEQAMLLNQDVATPANPFNGNFYEISFHKSSTLSNADFIKEIEKVEGYLALKYKQQSSLPSAHPYKINPPNSNPIKS